MTSLLEAVAQVQGAQARTGRPMAIILAGHNGSGKSTMWRRHLSDILQMPLINADRMMLSILPEPNEQGDLPPWAGALRDTDRGWMGVAQKGVEAFAGHAMLAKVPFAMETVFSHWQVGPDGRTASKIDLILKLQDAGYFVLLVFVGLRSADLSVFRVRTRVMSGGHAVAEPTLRERFPRTQKAIGAATKFADAAILTDNSRSGAEAYTVCRVQLGPEKLYDVRDGAVEPSRAIMDWLILVSPA